MNQHSFFPIATQRLRAMKLITVFKSMLIAALIFPIAPAIGLAAENSSGTLQANSAQTTQNRTVKGTVVDQNGDPLVGVTITIANSSMGTITDTDGNFSLPSVSSNDVIIASYVGYLTVNQSVGEQSTLLLRMREDSKVLDEVVVVGFGSQKKINLTGSVSQVSMEKLASRPVQNVSQALQGVVPGLNISTNNRGGELNNTMNVNIRGGGTIGAGSTSAPLILIDGMEGNMNAINPNDIESISVLKDAAAASVYGSRAPFGVILITTKKGKAGRTAVNYSNSMRFSDPLLTPKMMDSYKFATFFNDAATNGGQSPIFNQVMLDRILAYQRGELKEGTSPHPSAPHLWDSYNGANANTDWFKELYKRWVFSQEHNVSVSAGSERVTAFFSGNFMDTDGYVRYGDDNYKRYSLNGKLGIKLSDWAELNYGARWIREDYERASYQTALLYHNIARRWPTNPVYDPNGYFLEGNEIIQLKDGGRQLDQKDWLYHQVQLKLEPIKDWNIYMEGNARITDRFEHWSVLPIYAHDVSGTPFLTKFDDSLGPGSSRVNEYAWKENFYTLNLYSDYFKQFNNGHYIKGMVGFNAELLKARDLNGRRDNLITANLPTLNTATDNQRASGGYSHWSTLGFFGRINYNYKERYLLELNGRFDGTSRFIREKRWNLFPSLSVGWNIAQEEFWGSLEEYVSTFKLKGSYGELGNQNTTALYPFYQTMPFSAASSSWIINGERPNTSSAPDLVSSLLTWERVQSWNIGLDFAAFDNRLTGTVEYFLRKTIDMVGPAPELPVILGATVPRVNNADMESAGYDIEVSWRDRVGDVTYGIKGVLSDSKQRVTRYPNTTNAINTWYNGRYSGDIWGYETIGIAKTTEEMNAHLATLPNGGQTALGQNWSAGDIMYRDINGDGKIDGGAGTLGNTGDLAIIGNSTPRYNFGITLDAQWKGLDISLFFQGVGKRDFAVGGPYFWGASGGLWQSAAFVEHLDYFRPEGHVLGANLNSYYPRPLFSGAGKNQQTQTRYLQDASYIRLKNIQLGYSIPKHLLTRVGIQSLRVFVSGENLLTATKLTPIFDPETIDGPWGHGKVYPLSKIISFGLNINL